jgi:VWFA-related protein
MLSLFGAARAQEPEALVLRVTVKLVQVDAVVNDKRGRPVTDLKAEDFEILQDGKRQKVTHCMYIPAGASHTAALAQPSPSPGPMPAAKLERQQVRRTIAVVVDDLGVSFASMVDIRRALKKFVDEQVQPDDLVAIIRTAGDVGALQQFTSDKRRLYAAVDRLRWHWRSRVGLDSFLPSGVPFPEDTVTSMALEALQKLTAVVGALRDMPGHKSIMLFSEGVPLPTDVPPYAEALEAAYDRLIDLGARASATIYCIDARGLPTLTLSAARNYRENRNAAGELDPGLAYAAQASRYRASQHGMRYLADATGGKFLGDISNDLSVPVGAVMDDLQGYYSLGYSPAESTFNSAAQRKLHKIKVGVKRAGLTVRSPSGFFGEEDRTRTAPPAGSTAEMVASMISPFSGGDIAVEATSLFLDAAEGGPGITTMVHVDPAGLTFREQADGWREAQGDIAILVLGDNGNVAAQTALTFGPRLRGADYDRALAEGLEYVVRAPLKKAGSYDVRVAVRDRATRKLGTAGQFVEIPELKPGRLALSGILLQADAEPGGTLREGSALRLFHPGQTLTYAYQVLNPKLEPRARKPKVEALVKLYRDGKEVFAGKAAPVEAGADAQRLPAGGSLKIGPEMPPGDYVLQVAVTDLLASQKPATQWIDFRVAP